MVGLNVMEVLFCAPEPVIICEIVAVPLTNTEPLSIIFKPLPTVFKKPLTEEPELRFMVPLFSIVPVPEPAIPILIFTVVPAKDSNLVLTPLTALFSVILPFCREIVATFVRVPPGIKLLGPVTGPIFKVLNVDPAKPTIGTAIVAVPFTLTICDAPLIFNAEKPLTAAPVFKFRVPELSKVPVPLKVLVKVAVPEARLNCVLTPVIA